MATEKTLAELREERRQLNTAVLEAVDAGSRRIYRAMATGVGGRPTVSLADAQAALDAFDAAHPEVLQAIRSEKAAKAAGRMWD